MLRRFSQRPPPGLPLLFTALAGMAAASTVQAQSRPTTLRSAPLPVQAPPERGHGPVVVTHPGRPIIGIHPIVECRPVPPCDRSSRLRSQSGLSSWSSRSSNAAGSRPASRNAKPISGSSPSTAPSRARSSLSSRSTAPFPAKSSSSSRSTRPSSIASGVSR